MKEVKMNHPKEIAVFGGTFNPPTLAHEMIIGACLNMSEFDEVWVMPSGQRLDKPDMLDNQTRLDVLEAMRRGTFKGIGRLVITDFEMQLPQPTHTYDTVRALGTAYPSYNFSFVFGADSLATMHTWEHGEQLKQELQMLIVPRQGTAMPKVASNIRRLNVPEATELATSSTEVRQAIIEGEPVDKLVSPAVKMFINSHHCYEQSEQVLV